MTRYSSISHAITPNIRSIHDRSTARERPHFIHVILYLNSTARVSIKSALNATAYEDMTVEDGSKIYADMLFDRKKQHLYALLDRKIYKLKVQECTRYTTCKSCLGSSDPYCGWCSLENKCSLQEECDEHEQSIRWLTSCITITHVVPDKIQKEHEKNIQVGHIGGENASPNWRAPNTTEVNSSNMDIQ